MDSRKELLIKSAARLYSLGIDLEAARLKYCLRAAALDF